MALSDLMARLDQEAQTRVEAIQREAEGELRAIEADSERTTHDITTHALERGRVARHMGRQQELALARRQARTRELEALHGQIDRILTRARALIPEIAASPSYLAAIPTHLEEALRFVDGVPSHVRCQSRFAAALLPTIARHDGVRLIVDETIGPGVVVDAGDGSVVVDNTIAARLARGEPRLAIELSRRLREHRDAAP